MPFVLVGGAGLVAGWLLSDKTHSLGTMALAGAAIYATGKIAKAW